MATVDFNGARFWVDAVGRTTAPALVMMHSGLATARMWDPIVDALSASHRVIRYDCRGFGRTESDASPFSDVDDLLAIMSAARVGQATLVGASWGGRIAIDATLREPERVRGLVTIGSSPSGYPPVKISGAEQMASDALDAMLDDGDYAAYKRSEAELWAVGATRSSSDVDPAFLSASRALALGNVHHQHDQLDRVEELHDAYGRTHLIDVPALLIVGEHDLTPARSAAAYLHATVPRSGLEVVSGTAHSPSVESPARFSAILTSWLLEHDL